MLQFRLLLLIGVISLPKKPVFAFSHLSPRDSDNIWDFDWGAAGAGVLGGAGGILYNILNPPGQQDKPSQQDTPNQEDTTTTTNPKNTVPGSASPGPLFSEPNYELGTPPQQPQAPTREPSAPPPQCDTTNIFSTDCGKVLDQLVFTTGCAKIFKGQVPTAIAITQNGAILDELNIMAPGRVRTSTSRHCGIFMFMAPLTADQSRQIALMPGVSRVTSNIFFEGSDSSMNPQPDPGVIEPAYRRGRLRKRDIIRQRNAPAHLQFLSTPENYPRISTDYIYDSTAGANTVVFPIGPGLEMNHEEFINKPITHDDFIFADDVHADDTLNRRSFGTCMASLIMGAKYGVAKRTKLRPVRIESHVGSLISAMVKIANYVMDQSVNGFVMIMDMAWQNTEPGTTEEFEHVFEMLLYDYDVVTVVASGTDTSETNGQINSYPALYAVETPVITVGAVDMSGQRFSWSRGGVGLTVSAPGIVVCASNQGGIAIENPATGTALAAAQAGGLAAYLLTVYPHLRAEQNPVHGAALAMKDFMVRNAWARSPGGDISIWNMMGPEMVNPSGTGNGIGPLTPY